MPVYSIIVPVYNAEQYLAECLESILAQDAETEYEVILVDDGSVDGSGRLCDAYAARYGHIRVIHQENGGVSSARNAGLAHASGEYIFFCDSDDLLSPSFFTVIDALRSSGPDMISICTRKFGAEAYSVRPMFLPAGETGTRFLERHTQEGAIPLLGICSYVYRRRFLLDNGLRLRTDLDVAEDVDFNLSCLTQAASVKGTWEELYLYRRHGASVSMRASVPKLRTNLSVWAAWFRRFPNAAFANQYCYRLLGIAELGSREAVGDILGDFRKNRDILRLVSDRRLKFSRVLFYLIGVYNSSVCIQTMIRLRHALFESSRRREIAGSPSGKVSGGHV